MDHNVRVLLLATSETEKLSPLTETMPTPMIPLGNRPVMAYLVEMLARQGIKNILVSLYYLPSHIEAYFETGRRWGVTFEYILQREAWGSAGALKWAEGSLGCTFIVVPADSVIDLDLDYVLTQHHSQKNIATVVVHHAGVETGGQMDNDDRSMFQLPDIDSVCETGVFVFEPSVLDYIPPRTRFDIQSQLLPTLRSMNVQVGTCLLQAYWNPVDNFQQYLEAQRSYLVSSWNGKMEQDAKIRYASLDGTQVSPGIRVGRNNIIHPSAKFAPPVYIGDNCRIGRDVEIGPDVIVGSNIIIDDEATIGSSIILDHTYVGKLVNIENRIVNRTQVIDISSGESIKVTDKFLLDRTYQTDIDSGLKRFSDLLIASALIILALPLMLLLGMVIFLTSGGVFQTVVIQKCALGSNEDAVSDDSSTFNLLRFMTRRENGQFTLAGRWLENWELHRLPELLNVINGDLSLIGVKPLSLEESALVADEWQLGRYESPPGFSGLWYVQTGPDSELVEILIADVYYASTRSWRGDMILLGQTITTWFRRLRS